jgi:hypothetical protein
MFLAGDLNSRDRAVFIGVTVTFILASLFVAARLVARFGIVKRRGWDDYFILLAWVSEPSAHGPKRRLMHLPQAPRFWHVLRCRLRHLQGSGAP